MCGIFYYSFGVPKASRVLTLPSLDFIIETAMKLVHRGPDRTKVVELEDALIIFFRLSIMGLHYEKGMQPFFYEGYYCICNGEIYNYDKLREDCDLDYEFVSGSDCEIIIPLFMKYGTDIFKMMIGEFACVIRTPDGEIIAARDGPVGVRPLFYGSKENGAIIFASEAKSIIPLLEDNEPVNQFPPGHYWRSSDKKFVGFMTPSNFTYNTNKLLKCDYNYITSEPMLSIIENQEKSVLSKMESLLVESVKLRLKSDAPIGFLLSGGLDSSLVVAIARKLLGPKERIRTFSIGLPGSPDLKAAKEVAKYLDTEHHEVVASVDDGINAIKNVIYHLESYDQTTIYAGTYQYVLCKWIKDNTDVKVLLGGELADEVNASYRYIGLAPTTDDAVKENKKLLDEVHYYDILRADRMISASGIESRVPFSDPMFVRFMVNLDIRTRKPNYDKMVIEEFQNIEKIYLRKAFTDYLPERILWRKKEAFSDGVSHNWVTSFKATCEAMYTDEEFIELACKYIHNKPMSKDDLYFRECFEKEFGNRADLIPHKWIPNPDWNLGVTESSARFLSNYE